MTRDEIDRILERLCAAEQKRDINAILATYTEDIEHDAVGREPNPITGKAAIGVFYRGVPLRPRARESDPGPPTLRRRLRGR